MNKKNAFIVGDQLLRNSVEETEFSGINVTFATNIFKEDQRYILRLFGMNIV